MSQFSKRHYEAIAQTLQDTCPRDLSTAALQSERRQWESVCEALASTFKRDNYAFSHDRFIHACEPGANVKARTAHLKTANA